jgi:(p)ppGpp synthase/HD superfamily hydrolase
MATLDRAVALAAQAHLGQTDKAGAPYILHPLRVMFRCQSESAMMAAVLHDVVEDTSITLAELRSQGFSEAVISAVASLTRLPDETYEAFIVRVQGDPIAKEVKIADLEDNMDLRRLADPQPKDLERLSKYRRAWRELTGR